MFSFLFDPINISLIVTALLNLLLGALIFISGKNKRINIIYSLNIVAIISWVMAMFFYRSSPEETNLLWCTILYVTPTLVASSFLYFTYIFPSQKEKYIWWKTILIFGVNLAIIVMVIWPGLIIKEVNIRPGLEKQIIFTSYYWFYFLYTLSFFSFGFFRLFIKYLKNRGIERLQIIYLVTGYSLAANLAFGTNLIMPWLGFFFLNWLGQVFTCIMVAFTTYAILKYRLMDIRIVTRKIVIYFLSAGFVYGMFYLVTWTYNKSFGGIYNNGAYILGLVVAPLFVVLFAWLNNKIKIIANKYLFLSLYNYQETINSLSQQLNYINDLDEIVKLIVDTVKQSMQLDKAGVLLVEQKEELIHYKVAKVVGFDEKNGISLVQDNFLTRYLQETQKILIREELSLLVRDLRSEESKKRFMELDENMKHIEASLCLPLMSNKKLIGIVVLGSKVSGDAYTKEDIELLSTLSYQAGIAIDNARLYKEIYNLNKNLQQKVDEQTKDIKRAYEMEKKAKEETEQAYEVEKEAHEELKKLDEAKTNFMLVTQHHLRTPLTGTRGFLDLVLKGVYGKVPKKISEAINRAVNGVDKEIDVVNALLTVSTFQLGDGGVHPDQNVSIKKMLEEIVSDLKPVADERNIYLKLESADKESIPEIFVDQKQIKMALQNIIDNAIKYTKQGGVDVKIKAENDKIKIEVKDTGIGMDLDDRKYLFEKAFQRSKEAWSQNATGKGIGVYLSAQIIKAHGGKIWAESEGRGKGSSFYIELPINVIKNK